MGGVSTVCPRNRYLRYLYTAEDDGYREMFWTRREDEVCGGSRPNKGVSTCEIALRGLLAINGQNDDGNARVHRVLGELVESDLLKYCFNENPFLFPMLVYPGVIVVTLIIRARQSP